MTTTQELLDGILDRESEMYTVTYPRLRAAAKKFEAEVWFNGLQDQVLAEKYRGMSTEPNRYDFLMGRNPVTVLTYVMAGRCMIQLERGAIRFTIIAADNSKESTMGVQGIDATLEQAEQLVEDAIAQWRDGRRLDSNPDVNMGF